MDKTVSITQVYVYVRTHVRLCVSYVLRLSSFRITIAGIYVDTVYATDSVRYKFCARLTRLNFTCERNFSFHNYAKATSFRRRAASTNFLIMDSQLPHIVESADCDGSLKSKDRLINLLDQIEVHVEQLRKDASRLEEERDTLLTTLDTLRNNEILSLLEDTDRDDILRYAERLSMRCLTVDVLVKIQRDQIQEEALHQVNGLIDSLVISLRDDPVGTRQRCASFMNACTSQGFGQSDKNFETAILGCTMDDQKRIKKRLQGLLDYIDKMHTIQLL